MTTHSAPAVRYPVGRSYFHLTLIVVLGCLGALGLAGWVVVQGSFTSRHAVGWAVWLGAALLAGVAWERPRVGELAYDGQGWTWIHQGRSDVVSVRVELDLQHTVLLRASQPGRRSCWLWLQRSSRPALWLTLRRAVFARYRAAPSVPEGAGLA